MSTKSKYIQTHYIIGIGRSGTTLLSKLLNQHQNCLVTLETDFVTFFLQSFKEKKQYSETDFKLVTDYFDVFFKLNPSGKNYFNNENLYQDLLSSNIKSYQDLIQFVYLRFNYLKKPIEDIHIIVDKKPSYSLHIKDILAINPEAKFIYLVRDYRANILSRKQSVERRSPNIIFNAYRWLFFNRKINAFQKQYPNKIKEIKYEDLILETTKTMNQIFDFLSLSGKDTNTHYYENQVIKSQVIQTKNKDLEQRLEKTQNDIEKPIFTSRIDAWREELNKLEIKQAEVICGDYGTKFGYISSLNINSIKKLFVKAIHISNYLKALYDYKKEFLLIKVNADKKLQRLKSKYKIS